MNFLKDKKGFTLVEMMLVMVIMGLIIMMGIRYYQQRTTQMISERAALQMQQILNAGMTFYVAKGRWPTSISDAEFQPYLPPKQMVSPWGESYYAMGSTGSQWGRQSDVPSFYVWVKVGGGAGSEGRTGALAYSVANLLPMGYASEDFNAKTFPPDDNPDYACNYTTTQNCAIAARVNVPGQNLNNARAVNFAGLYKHGACVPVPQCPVDSSGKAMTPQIMVVPVSMAGANDPTNRDNVFPITSFTAYATGPTSDVYNPDPVRNSPPKCSDFSADNPGCGYPTGERTRMWRACLQVTTQKGDVAKDYPKNAGWGDKAMLMAITRCAVQNEPSGSPMNIWSN